MGWLLWKLQQEMANAGGGAVIDDSIVAIDKVWSSSKVSTELGKKLSVVKTESELRNEIANAGAAEKTIVLSQPINLTADLNVPENIGILFLKGAYIDGTYNLNFNGSILAGVYRIFGDNVNITGNPKAPEAYPEWFGAKGNGVTDDRDAIQKCLDIFKTCKLQPKTYKIRQPILMHSGYQLRGEGVDSIVWNDGTYTGYALGKQCILIGNMKGDPSTFTDLTFRGSGVTYTTASPDQTTGITAYSGDFWLTVADVTGFQVGDLVWIWSQNQGTTLNNGKWIPLYQQINKILEIDSTNSKIRLEQPIYTEVTDTLYICKNNGSDEYFMSENVVVENVKFKADADTWYRLGGAYKCKLRNIWVECKGTGIIFNGFAYSTLENLFAFAGRSCVDLGHFSHHSTFRNCIVSTYHTAPVVSQVGIYEGSHDNIFDKCIFQSIANNDVADGYHGVLIINSKADFKNCKFIFGTVTRIIHNFNHNPAYRFGISKFKDCEFDVKECNYAIANNGGDYILEDCKIKTKPLIHFGLLENGYGTPNLIGRNVIIDVPQNPTFTGFASIRNASHNCEWDAVYKNAFPDRDNLYTAKQHMPFRARKFTKPRTIQKIRGTKYTSGTATTILKVYIGANELTDEDLVEIYISGVANGSTSTKTVSILIYTPNASTPEYQRDFTIGAVTGQKFMYRFTGGVANLGSIYWRFNIEAYDDNGYRLAHGTPNVDTSQEIIIEIQVKVDTPATGEEIIPDITYIKIQNW